MNNFNESNKKKPDHHNKGVEVIINGRVVEIHDKQISFAKIIELALGSYNPSANIAYTVTYSRNHHDKGLMVEGDVITVRRGMVFNVTKTTRS